MRLHVHEFGDPAGEPVICLHGVSGHGGRFRRLAEDALDDRRVIAPDLRGHGRSAAEPPWTTAAHAADALELARALGVERADWIGYSFGGRIAAAVAATARESVRRMALLDPALQLPVEICLELAEAELAGTSFATPDEAIEERLAGGLLFNTPRETLAEEMREHLERGPDGRLRYRYHPGAAIGAWSEMAAEPPPVADVPTLIVRGNRSWVPVAVERWGGRAEVVELPGSGHSLTWDAPAETAEVVGRFLAA